MNSDRSAFYRFHRLGEGATHPMARRAGRLAVLLLQSQTVALVATLLAGDCPAAAPRPFDGAQDRLASQLARRTLGRVQLPFLGLCK